MYTLDNLDVYKLAQTFGDKIWFIVAKWDNFAKFGLGRQLTNAADSIASNIAEGYGRYFIRENIQFCFYSRGSVLETKNWLQRCEQRGLIRGEEFEQLLNSLEIIHRKLNGYIKVLKANLGKQKN